MSSRTWTTLVSIAAAISLNGCGSADLTWEQLPEGNSEDGFGQQNGEGYEAELGAIDSEMVEQAREDGVDELTASGPKVSWTAPSESATVSGLLNETKGNCTVAVSAASAINRVEFLLDDVLLNTERSAPYSCLWDTATASYGSHELKAIAYDADGNSGSSLIRVFVADPRAVPTIGWSAPLPGETVSGVLNESNGNCLVSAAASSGVDRVEFKLDGALLNTERSAPFACSWDAAQATSGSHVLQAIVYDKSGRMASASITVNVSSSLKATRSFYVDSANGKDTNTGLSSSAAWKTLTKVNAQTFKAGDVIHFKGTFDGYLLDNGSGTSESARIVYVGDGPYSGRARIRGIRMTSLAYVTFRNFEASDWNHGAYSTSCTSGTAFPAAGTLIKVPYSGSNVTHINFENLYLHDADVGVDVGPGNGKSGVSTDLKFVNTTIQAMWRDGIVLEDNAGNRFSYIGGSIKDTGNRGACAHWAVHGIYASGGHGHLIDGVQFGDNANGASFSMRRGDVTVRNCRFSGGAMIHNNNEDEGTSGSKNLTYRIYRNVFVGPGTIYQGGVNDTGTANPGNTWALFNNTFVSSTINFGGADSKYYNVYMRNNVLVGSKVQNSAVISGRVHVYSNNGWYNSGSALGTSNLTTNPALDSAYAVTASGYKDAGTKSITPSISMVASTSDPLGYSGSAPDIGKTER